MKKLILVGIMALLPMAQSVAQCAMCRAVVNSTISDGRNDVGNGLNFGILYMLVFPYLLVTFGGIWWYRKAKENQRKQTALEQQMLELRLRKS